MMKVLGLDLGTNSIGWAITECDENGNPIRILQSGSRIIPMDAGELSNFDNGKTESKTAIRTNYRGIRRLLERNLLRRERLLRVLNILNFLPIHFAEKIGWDESDNKTYGKFIDNSEPKLAWRRSICGKNEFIFIDSFNMMLADFVKINPQLISDNKKIPLDWTLFYLRKKALTQKITKEELAWIILNFNQKRGYYQLRGEDLEEQTKTQKTRKYFDKQIIKSITDSGDKYKDNKILLVELEDGTIGKIFKKETPNWTGLEKNIIITVDLDVNGEDKKDEDKYFSKRFSIPTDEEWEKEWQLIKLKTESDLKLSGKTVGNYIYDELLKNPNLKIKGKLVRTIERDFYVDELYKILESQAEFHDEFNDRIIYNKCIENLYPNNENHKLNIKNLSLIDFIIKDILFYQRPLKSKKSLISNCPYELTFDKREDKVYPIKCIAKSNPLFQEFRLWQFISNLNIFKRESLVDGRLMIDEPVKNEFLKNDIDYTNLFDFLNNRDSIDQQSLLKYFVESSDEAKSFIKPALKKKYIDSKITEYRWNYVEDKKYPCNETRSVILKALKKLEINADFLTSEIENTLWHLLYSVEDRKELKSALEKFRKKHNILHTDFVEVFAKIKPFEKDYGAYSQKAINKLLPLMWKGKFWNESKFDATTLNKINNILSGVEDNSISQIVREKCITFRDIIDFQGLPIWLACYIVYDRYSETKDNIKWKTPKDIDLFLEEFKQHSLRNPVVEQIITETLRTVRDIWSQFGDIKEIHIELGREMKNPTDKRAKITQTVNENENTNLRIKALLAEFINPELNIENVKPYSPSQQEILKIYEEYALSNLSTDDNEYKFIEKISKTALPSKNDIIRYKCWLEQKYRSPYTGETIPLSKLFTTEYEIEHIIPKSRYFDDSYSNKIICEEQVNKIKDNQLAYEFIKNHRGEVVVTPSGKTIKIFTPDEYEDFVKRNYFTPRLNNKMKKLLMSDIPEDFIARQLNDSRYISKYVKMLLSNVVREMCSDGEYEKEAISKNIITCNGAITDRLKKDWGINDVWNRIILPRFKRLNDISSTDNFTSLNSQGHLIPNMPLDLQKGFNKKRIDHRHHAMDAIIIACTTKSHVNLLNNESANNKKVRFDLSKKLRRFEKREITKRENGELSKKIIDVACEFYSPWNGFQEDVYKSLQDIVVSFKQNLRVITKTNNKYQKFINGKKEFVPQKGSNVSIRKSLHKETVYGLVNLRFTKQVGLNDAINNINRIVNNELKNKLKELLGLGFDNKKIKSYFEDNKEAWRDVNISKIDVYYFTNETNDRYYATRKPLDASFNKAKIDKEVTDTGIKKILNNYLDYKNNNSEVAFSPEGIEELNNNISKFNNGVTHKPILKVRLFEKGEKFAVGSNGNKSNKFVEAAKGTNLFFMIFEKEVFNKKENIIEKARSFHTIPLNIVIQAKKIARDNKLDWKLCLENYLKGENPDNTKYIPNEYELLFILSPNDLVYLPTEEEIKSGVIIEKIDYTRVYKFMSCTKNEGHFIPQNIASPILDTKELGSNNKAQRAWTNEMIKETCVPLSIDRLGNIKLKL